MSLEFKTDTSGNNAPIKEGLVVEVTANKSLSYEESGVTFLVGTDALVISLPETKAGVKYSFVNSGAAANNIITVSPTATDGIAGTITLASSVVVLDGTINKDVINTKATSQAGDTIVIEGTGVAGVTAWIVKSSTGIWAREA